MTRATPIVSSFLPMLKAFLALAGALFFASSWAEPGIGQRFSGNLETGVGYRIPLPPGNWEATGVKTEEQTKNVTRHLVLRNLDSTALVPFMVVRYASKQFGQNWADHCGGTTDPAFLKLRHGSSPTSLMQKCQRYYLSRLPRDGEVRDKWTWDRLYDGFSTPDEQLRNDSFVRTDIVVSRDGADFSMINLFIRAPKPLSAVRDGLTGSVANPYANEIAEWTASYVNALTSSVIERRFQSVVAFRPPADATRTAVAAPVGKASAQAQTPPDKALEALHAQLDAARKDASPSAATSSQAERERADRLAADVEAERRKRLEAESRLAAQIESERKARVALEEKLAAESRERERLATASSTANQQKSAASAPKIFANRKALVIGNDRYTGVPALSNAAADADAVANTLRTLGFNVYKHTDLSEKAFKAALREFRMKVEPGDEVMFFFAGHGVQLGNINYLLPIDVKGDSEDQVRDEAIQLQRVLDDMQDRKTKFALAVIDACRDNPFKGQGRAIGGRGLAPTTAATGQMIMFSAGSGQQALDKLGKDDKERNGLFTRVFVKEMTKPGVSVDRVLRNVRQEVVSLAKSVGHEQVPALYDQAVGEFFFRQ